MREGERRRGEREWIEERERGGLDRGRGRRERVECCSAVVIFYPYLQRRFLPQSLPH